MSIYSSSGDELVCQRASPLTVAGLLGSITVFTVPPFQRDYAWDENAIDLFVGDVDRCRERRVLGTPQPHFFGAIVTTPQIMPGTPCPYSMLIDGQQRLATAFLYLTELRRRFDDAATRAETEALRIAFSARSGTLRSNFERIEDLEFHEPKTRCRLNLNRVDDPFFKQLLEGKQPPSSRASHGRMLVAVNKIKLYFNQLFERRGSSEDDDRILTTLYESFIRDWEIVHISARTRRQANTIYRVLNSRGVPVSDCDLLRAATLERVEDPLDDPDIQGLSQAWDDVLGLDTKNPDTYLDFAFQSRNGERRPTDRTATSFESSFFPILDIDERLKPAEAQQVLREVTLLRDDCVKAAALRCGDIGRGSLEALSPVMSERFRTLTHLFQQDYCIPLLLSASSLPLDRFAALVNLLDRFAFRYGVLVRAPVGPFERCVKGYILALRDRPDVIDLDDLQRDLQSLLDNYAALPVFIQRIKGLRYGTGENPIIRYLLAMIEWTDVWYSNGGNGSIQITDETRGIDLSSITLEHIGAKRGEDATPELQPLLNTLGNLTLLSEGENDAAGNNQFVDKVPIYHRSNFAINRKLVANGNRVWGATEVSARETELLARSQKIFTLVSD